MAFYPCIHFPKLDEGAEIPREEISRKGLSEEVCETLADATKLNSPEVTSDDGVINGVRRPLLTLIPILTSAYAYFHRSFHQSFHVDK